MKQFPPRHPLATALLCALMVPSAHAAADHDTADKKVPASELDAIEVRAQGAGPRAPLAIESAKARLDERAGATGLVDAERYRDGRVSTLSDALGYATGVFVQPRFGAEEARIAVRGSGLQRTFHGRGLKVLQDGVPVNLADGGFDMQGIEPLSTRYVEVWRGANALEFGAATLGGAVNFVTPTGYDASGWRLRGEAGSFGYGRWQAQWGGHEGAHDGVVSLSGFAQDSFRDNAPQENHRLFANYGHRFNDDLEGRVYVSKVDTRSALPGSISRAQFEADPRQANAGSVALDQRRDFELDRISAKLVYAASDASEWQLSGYYSDKFLDHPIFQVLQQDSRDRGIDARWRFTGELGGRRNVFTAGIGFSEGDTRDDRFVNRGRTNPDDHRGARTGKSDQLAENQELFMENQHWLNDQWVLALGVQALSSSRRFDDLFRAGGIDRSFDADYDGVNPKIGLRFAASEALTVFGNVSRSTEPPSFGELSGGPNITQVDEQQADSAELGLRFGDGRWVVDAVAYRAQIKDELLALNDAAGNPLGTRNADDTIHQGIELGFDVALNDAWALRANYLLNDFRFDDDAVYEDNELAGIPRQWLRAELGWQPRDGFRVAPAVEWVASDYYIDHANTVQAPGYAIVSLRVSGQIDERWSWFIDGRNLADRDYIATTGVVADARGLDGAYYLPGDGRAVYAGFDVRF